ncbi:MAG: preprotein translocase subunit SecE [Bacteroidia bacterium]|nr:preprotein translocase subunit SecE [Bacteroidia bacterium]MCZ2277018.1 preprotein translocase subunit SecE [Bacteroidia bacterium]
MKKFKNYLSDCYLELSTKVTWPSWNEVQSSSIVVLIACLIISLIVFLMDVVFQNSMNFIYSVFS